MKKFFVFLILFLIAVFFTWHGIYSPVNCNSLEEKLFSIEKGQGLFQIAENLEKQDLVKNRFLFSLYIIFQREQGNLQAGKYLLNPSMNIPVISQKIISGETHTIKITIPEGYNLTQIEEKLNLKLPEENLEGFLFPDTYQFPIGVSGEEVVRIMKDNFDKKLSAELREEIEKQDKTIFEIITMASMIEKEVRTIEDKKLVSGILWKRLESKMPLQVDATITYITGKATTKISIEELKIDSPYNTYKYLGLPAGPICNPGLDSILAAVYPKDSGYWYYLSNSKGETVFSKTLKEHRINKEKYL
ncbi:endolytic transglycosylase MltG [Candidatus Parcubacteria bacterium]|nr:endolytic transglycosylase MltG [Candidatus Parcubacteria bacterium]